MSCENCVQQLTALNYTDDAIVKFIQECPDDIEFFLDRNFLHYRSGSNWNNKPAEYVTAKTNALHNLLARILA